MMTRIHQAFIRRLYLEQGYYAFGSVGLFVCLSVCLFVSNITQKAMNSPQ